MTAASPSVAAAPAKTPPSGVRLLLTAAVLMAILALPIVALMFTPLASGAGAAMPGIFVAALSLLNLGVRKGLLLTAVSVVAIGISPVGVVYPAIGVMILVSVGALTGLAAFRGAPTPVIEVAILMGLTMIGPSALTARQVAEGVTVTPTYLVTLVGINILSAAWASLCVVLLWKKLPKIPRQPLRREGSIVYGATMAFLLGAVGAVSLTWFPYTLAGWTILTICVIVRPMYPHEGVVHGLRHRAEHRAAGTLGGVIIAAGIAAVVHNSNALVIIGLAFLVAAVGRLAAGVPYWQFVILLTPSMVFMGNGGTHVDRVALVRLGCSLLGIVLAIGALEFNRRFTFPWIARERALKASTSPSGDRGADDDIK